MSEKVWKQSAKVALKEDPKYRGEIIRIIHPYNPGDKTYYEVRWKGYSNYYQYSGEMLIDDNGSVPEKESVANKPSSRLSGGIWLDFTTGANYASTSNDK